jgi:hypothetical protein
MEKYRFLFSVTVLLMAAVFLVIASSDGDLRAQCKKIDSRHAINS